MAKKQLLNAVVTMRIEVSASLLILQVAPYGWEFPLYRPGQFALLGLPGADPRNLIKRSYSIASSPARREYLEFCLILVPGGVLTPRLFKLKVGDRIWLSRTPAGNFTIEASWKPQAAGLIFCASGSAVAPFVSMLGELLKVAPEQRVTLIHSVRHSRELGYRSVLMAMQDLRSSFTYLPAISRPEDEVIPWQGHIGRVEDVWKSGAIERLWRKVPTPDDTHVFLCGDPRMTQAMIELLVLEGFTVDAGVKPGQVHVENFWQLAEAQPLTNLSELAQN